MNIFLISLGCDKNRVDSEEMLGILSGSGFSVCDDETKADVIIVNTCCFIDAAKEESIETILEMAEMKEKGVCKRLIVSGCMAQRYREEILKELPEVDAVVGVDELSDILKAVSPENAAGKMPEAPGSLGRMITTPGHYEFLKIADGCDKRCTYCIIPSIRGHYRSRRMEDILEEAEKLAESGVKELILVAQETTLYGVDIYGKKMLPQLLERLCGVEGIRWIRLLYTYPEEITDELLEEIAKEEKIVKYIDMPVQHASDRILRKMGRRTSRDDIINIINRAREIIPDVTLRTSLICGFPGETQEEHEELLDFVKETRFDRLGVFTYSQEEGTAAAEFDDQIPEEIKDRRRDDVMKLQMQISKENLAEKTGREFDVMIEGYLPDDDVYVGRTYMDAPDVDGFFYVESDRSLMTGDFIRAVCTGSSEYDLYGEEVNEPAE